MTGQRPRLFGTDGIRGAFGKAPLTEDLVRDLGAALAAELRPPEGPLQVVIGGDTRDSTPVLGRWLAEELAKRGARITDLGVVPTPAVAFAVRRLDAACGIAVSASHNPHPDNGIKLIDSRGFKWTQAAELRLERRMGDRLQNQVAPVQPPALSGVDRDLVAAYLESLRSSLTGERSLEGLTLALDTGHGAASAFASELFESLGARVRVVNRAPNGRNINDGCGSTRPEIVAALVRETDSDLGFAFDGDADRAILADENGEIRDGDAMLYLWARDLKQRGELPGNRIVATSMSNLGLEVALRRDGISLVRCDVGDREVVDTMRREGIELGGEQSGHLVSRSLSTTGDGLLTAIQIAGIRHRDGRSLSEMLSGFERYPQLLRNLRVRRKPPLDSLPAVVTAQRRVERQLGSEGRLVLRYSGTEALVRTMIEGSDRAEIEALADDLEVVLAAELS